MFCKLCCVSYNPLPADIQVFFFFLQLQSVRSFNTGFGSQDVCVMAFVYSSHVIHAAVAYITIPSVGDFLQDLTFHAGKAC